METINAYLSKLITLQIRADFSDVTTTLSKLLKLTVITSEMSNEESELTKRILRYKDSYYNRGIKEVSDSEYDYLIKKLGQINPENPVLEMVGSDFSEGKIQRVKHDPPMLSLDKLDDVSYVLKWASGFDIVWGYKIDGESLQLDYLYGEFVRASTRGEGGNGRNVTAQASHMTHIPRKIKTDKARVVVRGEAYLPISLLGEYKSARAAAVGALRSDDPSETGKRGVSFYAWELLFPGERDDMEFIDKVTWLRDRGFETADQELIKPSQANDVFNKVWELKQQGKFDFEMDGLVFKINSSKRREDLGETKFVPLWMISVKFPTEEQATTIIMIDWGVSGKGKVTPVARLNPVEVSQATISNVTLNNARQVRDMALAVGDEVLVKRAGDVIPYIVKVLSHSGNKVDVPTNCPVCGSLLRDTSVDLYCDNSDCDAKDLGWIKEYRVILKIKVLGDKTIDELYERGIVSTPADLYKLTESRWVQLLGKNGETIYKNIQEHKEVPFDIFIQSLNIKMVGEKASEIIADHISTWDDLVSRSLLDFQKMGLGDATARSIHGALLRNKQKYQELLDAGVIIKEVKAVEVIKGGKLDGQLVYVTGTPPLPKGVHKDALKEIITKNGGKYGWSPTKTKILVEAPRGGKEKLKIADDSGGKMVRMTWDEFVEKYDIRMEF